MSKGKLKKLLEIEKYSTRLKKLSAIDFTNKICYK